CDGPVPRRRSRRIPHVIPRGGGPAGALSNVRSPATDGTVDRREALKTQCWMVGGPSTADLPVSLPPTRIALGRAHMLASSAIRDAQRAGLPAHSITPAGDLRRFAPD